MLESHGQRPPGLKVKTMNNLVKTMGSLMRILLAMSMMVITRRKKRTKTKMKTMRVRRKRCSAEPASCVSAAVLEEAFQQTTGQANLQVLRRHCRKQSPSTSEPYCEVRPNPPHRSERSPLVGPIHTLSTFRRPSHQSHWEVKTLLQVVFAPDAAITILHSMH